MLSLLSRRLVLAVAALAVGACECGRETFEGFADAGPEADAGPPDAGPPPPQFPLNPGDTVIYSVMNVTKCNETISAQCAEKSTAWTAEYTVEAEGAALDPATNAWKVPAEYFRQVVDQKPAGGMAASDAEHQTLTKLWLTEFGPWNQAPPFSATTSVVYRTDTPLLQGGMPDTAPFFDMNKFAQAQEQFRNFVLAKDPNALIATQEAARRFEAGYLEPSDPSQLHYVEIIYHRHGFLCQISESIGPWDPTKMKNNSGFAGNQRDWQTSTFAAKLRRAGGTSMTCKCGTQMFGNDCD